MAQLNLGFCDIFFYFIFLNEVLLSVRRLWTGSCDVFLPLFVLFWDKVTSSFFGSKNKIAKKTKKSMRLFWGHYYYHHYYIYYFKKMGVNWHRHMTALANQKPASMRNRSPDGGTTGRRVRWRLTGTHSGTRGGKLRVACHFFTRTRFLFFKEVLLLLAR